MSEAPQWPPRVLHIGKYFPPHRGGMETFLRDLMVEQQRQGLSSSAIVHGSGQGFFSRKDVYEDQGVRLSITRVARWFTAAFAPISPGFGWQLHTAMRREGPDILHIHMPNLSAFWCLLLPAARRLPWVVHWHADVLASPHSTALRYLYRIYRPLEQALLRGASAIIATSPLYLESSEPLRAHRDRCVIVPLGIRAAPIPEAVHTEPLATGHPASKALNALYVGRLTYYKGVEFLIRAVHRVPGVRLTLVGSGDEEQKLRALTRTLGLEDRVLFAGSVPDVKLQRLISQCDSLCLPSIERTEAFGVVLLEAMRAGRAVIATSVPGAGMSWVVEHGTTGLIVKPEDPAALAQALEKMKENPKNRISMGRAGRSRFEHLFQIDSIAGEIQRTYENRRQIT